MSPVDESVQIQVGHNHGNRSALTGEVTPEHANHLHTPMNMTNNRRIDAGKQSVNATTISVIDRVETENRLKSPFLSSQNQSTISMSLEERKKAILASIAALKQQVQEQEEDEELRELLRQEEELKRKLSQGSTPQLKQLGSASKSGASKKNYKKKVGKEKMPKEIKKKPEVNMIQQELASLAGVDFDVSGFVNGNTSQALNISSVLSESELRGGYGNRINSLSLSTERKAKCTKQKAKRTKKSKSKRSSQKRTPSSSSESSSESSEGEDTESEEEEEIEEIKSRRKGKKFKSGLYTKLGEVRLVSREWYAHSALDEEVDWGKTIERIAFPLIGCRRIGNNYQ